MERLHGDGGPSLDPWDLLQLGHVSVSGLAVAWWSGAKPFLRTLPDEKAAVDGGGDGADIEVSHSCILATTVKETMLNVRCSMLSVECFTPLSFNIQHS